MKSTGVAKVILIVVCVTLAGPTAAADAKKATSEAVRKDIANHRAMADAHTNAATCLESGKSEKECHAQLQKDCKGVGLGKYCGMKHSH